MSKLFFIFLFFLLTDFLTPSFCPAGFYYAGDSKKPSLTQACTSQSSEKICKRKPLNEQVLSPYSDNKKRKASEKIKLEPMLPSSLSKKKLPNVSPNIRTLTLAKPNTGSDVTQTALPQWQALKGSTLRHVLEQWTGKARVDLEWGTEFDYPLLTSFDISGTFEEALKKLLDTFSESNPRPYGRLHRNGAHSVLVIQTRGKTHYDS
jgi:Toxin co-regulated pilus biosynthesis protein Q